MTKKVGFKLLTLLVSKFIHGFSNPESGQSSKPYQCNGSDCKSNLPCFNCHVLHATWFNCLEKSDDGMSSRWHGSKRYRAKCQHAHSAVGNFSWQFCHLTGFFCLYFCINWRRCIMYSHAHQVSVKEFWGMLWKLAPLSYFLTHPSPKEFSFYFSPSVNSKKNLTPLLLQIADVF